LVILLFVNDKDVEFDGKSDGFLDKRWSSPRARLRKTAPPGESLKDRLPFMKPSEDSFMNGCTERGVLDSNLFNNIFSGICFVEVT
jgi:hypothetical protein